MRRHVSLLVLVLSAFGLGSCGKGPLLLVTVNRLPEGVASLDVLIMRGDSDAVLERSRFPTSTTQTYSFGVRFLEGTTGALLVGVAALSEKGCVLGTGTKDVMLLPEQAESIVDLDPAAKVPDDCVPGAPTILKITPRPERPSELSIRGWGFVAGSKVRIAQLPADTTSPSLDLVPCVAPTRKQPQCQQPDRLSGATKLVPVMSQETTRMLRVSPVEIQIADDSLRAPTGKLGICVVVVNPDRSEGCRGTEGEEQLLSLTFQPRTLSLGRMHPDLAIVSDLNGDGRPDIALSAVEELEAAGDLAGAIAFYFNQNGDFPKPPVVLRLPPLLFDGQAYPRLPRSLVAAKINSDDRPDLVFAHPETDEVTILYNQGGDEPFSLDRALRIVGVIKPDSLAIADYTGDGKADLALLSDAFTGASLETSLFVIPQVGDGTFPLGTRYFVGLGLAFLIPLKADLDQHVDLVLTGLRFFFPPGSMVPDADGTGGGVLILKNDGSGQFPPVHPRSIGGVKEISDLQLRTGGTYGSIVAGDVDKRPGLDLVVGGATAGGLKQEVARVVTVFLNRGDGTYSAGVDYPSGPAPFGVALGDLNGDGWSDIAATNVIAGQAGKITVLLNQGGGTFPLGNLPSYATGTGATIPALSDISGDGKLDMAVAVFGTIDPQDPKKSSPGSLMLYVNTSR